ncbi:MAG TPA: NAD(P)/FAD-dependent oxidoreductase [Mucilaginibacter sp.]|nr:NAD(P)/FAD-dependent oxidoreductase [Mucilaginibacter sp.]
MNIADVIIIGAGATGLMAARTLAKAGKKVIVLEARDRCGGRIHTLHNESFFKQAELGAEFIHGDLPVTLNLLKEANIDAEPSALTMWRYKDGKFITDEEPTPHWDTLLEKLNDLQEDCSINEFLDKEFAGDEYNDLRQSVRRFAAGYDTADPDRASAFALRLEWENDDDDAQHRVKGGYDTMINFLADECRAADGVIYLNSAVTDVYRHQDKAEVITTDGTIYYAGKVLIALPLGVLQADEGEQGAIKFHPPVPDQQQAIQAMGFGSIIKILLEFDELFWENSHTANLTGNDPQQMSFILSDKIIPTWWTQAPKHNNILTGWLGGPAAADKKDLTEDELLELSLQSLGEIFDLSPAELQNKLIAFNCVNWTTDPYTRGSYAYDTVAAPEARKVLTKPVDDTLFFAGEYLYNGPAMGTVEAALTSGEEVARRIIDIAL